MLVICSQLCSWRMRVGWRMTAHGRQPATQGAGSPRQSVDASYILPAFDIRLVALDASVEDDDAFIALGRSCTPIPTESRATG